MNMQIQSIDFHAADNLKHFIKNKVVKLETYFDKIIDAEIFLKLDSHQQVRDKVAEIKINIPGITLFSSETSKTFEESVDLAVDSIKRQLKKRKEKNRK